jgi:hypothetical protein
MPWDVCYNIERGQPKGILSSSFRKDWNVKSYIVTMLDATCWQKILHGQIELKRMKRWYSYNEMGEKIF